MRESVLVTGGGGFIGHHLVRRLLADGHEVHVLVRYSNPVRYPRLAEVWDKIHTHEGDLRNYGSLRNAFSGMTIDSCFHLAAYNHVGQSWEQWEECYDTNAKGTANLFAALAPSTHVVHVSSSEVYGEQKEIPWHEEMTPHPSSPYGVTKLAGEHTAIMAMRGGMQVVAVRPFNAYGAWQSTKALIPDLIVNLIRHGSVETTGGKQTREFIFVGDVIDGLIRVRSFLEERLTELPINLASERDVSIKDLSSKIAAHVGNGCKVNRTRAYRPNEIWVMRGSGERANNLLNWTPKTKPEDGLKQTVEWYRKALAEGIAL